MSDDLTSVGEMKSQISKLKLLNKNDNSIENDIENNLKQKLCLINNICDPLVKIIG